MLQPKDIGWMDKNLRPINMLPPRDLFRSKDTHKLKIKGWRKIVHTNGTEKKAVVALIIFDKNRI